MGGQFILRIEDTDKSREVPNSIEEIIGMLEWCHIIPDEGPGIEAQTKDGSSRDVGPYIQSQRLHLYRKYCQQLVDSGAAYPCFCSKHRLAELKESGSQKKGYDGKCSHLSKEEARRRCESGEPHTIRMRIPQKNSHSLVQSLCPHGRKVEFHDELRGNISVDLDQLDDQILLKQDGYPT